MNPQSSPPKLILEEYLSGGQLFTHALQISLYEEAPVEVFLIDGELCDALTWLAELQSARRANPDFFLALENSKLTTRGDLA